MVQTKQKKPKKIQRVTNQPEGTFFLKLLLYTLVGSMWLKLTFSMGTVSVPIPVGLILGIAFTFHEKLQIDRKIEYAVLLVAMLIGYLAPYGIYLNFN